MARKKQEPEVDFLDRLGLEPDPAVRGVLSPGIDPSVAAAHEENMRRDKLRRMTSAQRKKYLADEVRNKVTADMARELEAALRAIAHEEGISLSALVEFFCAEGVIRYRAGELDPGPYKCPSRSPRFDWKLDLDVPMLAIYEQGTQEGE